MQYQRTIRDIIYSPDSRTDRIRLLRDFLTERGVRIFSDFDDTITEEPRVYSGSVFLSKKILGRTDTYERILHSFRLQESFRDVVKTQNIQGPFVILTRNELDFAEVFADRYAGVFTEIGLELVGVIGRTRGFRFSSRRKLDFLPEGSVFIGDCFEHADLRAHPRYHNVLHREAWDTFVARIMKGWYCAKNIFFGGNA